MRGYKRGDVYTFKIQIGETRKGVIVRSNKESITVLYKVNKKSRTRTFTKEDVNASKRRKI